MRFRTHVARPFDLSLWSNRIMFALVGVTAVAAIYLWSDGAPDAVLWAPVHTFAFWALAREVDPDRDLTAHLAALASGIWILVGRPAPQLPAVVALIFATRLCLRSTGRRPLDTDLVVLGAMAIATSLTRVGWVAAMALAAAFLADWRMAGDSRVRPATITFLTMLGIMAAGTYSGAFTSPPPRIHPWWVVGAGVVAIAAILQTPPDPFSFDDTPKQGRLERGRLHGSRVLLAVATVLITIFHGIEAERAAPLVGVLVMALVSSEVERARRRV